MVLASSSLEAPASGYASRAWRPLMNERAKRALRADRRAWFGAGVVVLIVLLALLAPAGSRHDPLRIDLVHQLQAPSPSHWLGTHIQGRGVWARLVYGARRSLSARRLSPSHAPL